MAKDKGKKAGARFAVGDRVTWRSQAAGSWKTKVGTVVEIVPPRGVPAGGSYWGSRDHEWFVVDVNGVRYYPRASALRCAPARKA